MAHDDALRTIVDASGFAFQLAMQNIIERSASPFCLTVAEHAWHHRHKDTSGFAPSTIVTAAAHSSA